MNTAVGAGRDHAHSHVVGFYDRDADLLSAVAKFFGDALRNNGAAVVVATECHRFELESILSADGYATHDLIECDRLQFLDAADTLNGFMVDGKPDAQRFASVVAAVIDRAAAHGGPVQVFGEMVALLWNRGNIDGAIALETLWNDIAGRYDFALFCAYTMSSLEASGDLDAATRVCDAHSELIAVGDRVFDGGAAQRVFVPVPSTLSGVRQFVRGVLGNGHDPNFLAEIDIVVSELATNALMHARTPFRVSVSSTPTSVRIAVRDTSFDLPDDILRHADRNGGRGVGLVAAFSRSWGTDAEPDGKTVWAELSRR